MAISSIGHIWQRTNLMGPIKSSQWYSNIRRENLQRHSGHRNLFQILHVDREPQTQFQVQIAKCTSQARKSIPNLLYIF